MDNHGTARVHTLVGDQAPMGRRCGRTTTLSPCPIPRCTRSERHEQHWGQLCSPPPFPPVPSSYPLLAHTLLVHPVPVRPRPSPRRRAAAGHCTVPLPQSRRAEAARHATGARPGSQHPRNSGLQPRCWLSWARGRCQLPSGACCWHPTPHGHMDSTRRDRDPVLLSIGTPGQAGSRTSLPGGEKTETLEQWWGPSTESSTGAGHKTMSTALGVPPPAEPQRGGHREPPASAAPAIYTRRCAPISRQPRNTTAAPALDTAPRHGQQPRAARPSHDDLTAPGAALHPRCPEAPGPGTGVTVGTGPKQAPGGGQPRAAAASAPIGRGSHPSG